MYERYVFINSFFVLLLLSTVSPTLATEGGPTTTVTLEKATQFMAADGSDVLVKPGTYELEAADTWLRLIPGERRDALLLEAHQYEHQEILHTPKAVVTEGEGIEPRLVLLLPEGKGLEAIGSASGIRSRAVKRARTSRSTSRTQQKSRIPTQSKNITQQVRKLENQVRTLQATINALQSRLTKIESAVQVDNHGNVTMTLAGKFTVNASTVDIHAGSITAHAGLATFSGVVKSDVISTNSVISKSYTPGAGNVW